MFTLSQALETCPAQKQTMRKYLALAKIHGWEDFDKDHLRLFSEVVTSNLAQSSARTVFASLKGLLGRNEELAVNLPKDWRGIISAKNEKTIKTFLTKKELKALEDVDTKNAYEQTVKYDFLISARTGMRISDTLAVTPENFVTYPDGRIYLDYVSKKTKVRAQVPVSERTVEMVKWVQENGAAVPLCTYNINLRKLCKRAGLTQQVRVFRAGEYVTSPKWAQISSHSARVSFCTNLAICGLDLLTISRMAGHTGIEQTERYIQRFDIKLNPLAEKYLND